MKKKKKQPKAKKETTGKELEAAVYSIPEHFLPLSNVDHLMIKQMVKPHEVLESRPKNYWQLKIEVMLWLARGLDIRHSCSLAGICKDNFYRFKKRYSDFCDDLKRAQDMNKAVHVMAIQKAGEINWTARAWYLERMYPEQFSIKKLLEIVDKRRGDPLAELMRDTLNKIAKKTKDKAFLGTEEKEEFADIPNAL